MTSRKKYYILKKGFDIVRKSDIIISIDNGELLPVPSAFVGHTVCTHFVFRAVRQYNRKKKWNWKQIANKLRSMYTPAPTPKTIPS